MRDINRLILFIMLIPGLTKATDRHVNSFGIGGAYTTITAAIAASSAGDRILIAPRSVGGTYNENFTIGVPLQLMCSVNDSLWTLTGNITFGYFVSGGVYSIINMNNPAGSITGTSGLNLPRATVSILNCTLTNGNINLQAYYINATVANCVISNGQVAGRHINLFGNNIAVNYTGTTINALRPVFISSEIATGDSIFVIGNIIQLIGSTQFADSVPAFDYQNSTQYFVIMNNYFELPQYKSIGLNNMVNITSNLTGTGENVLINNTLYTYGEGWTNDFYVRTSSATGIYNNFVNDNTGYDQTLEVLYAYDISIPSLGGAFSYNFWNGSRYGMEGVTNDGTNAHVSTGSYSDGQCQATNTGNPAIVFTDIDLTPNDIGTHGGSFSMTNFYPNTGNSRVYIVNAPRDVLQGAQLNISAIGYDR